MTRILIHIGALLIALVATAFFVYVVYAHLFVRLGDWTFDHFQQFLIVQLQPLDRMLMQWAPVLWSVPIVVYGLNYPRQLLGMTALGMGSMSLSLCAGIAWSLFTWKPDTSSPLLPEYIRAQPFDHYWTVFLLVGIALPIVWMMATHRKKVKDGNTID